MRGIVSNATPLIYLAKVGKLDLLRKIFGEVFIPEEVRTEVVDKGKQLRESDAYSVENAISKGWLKVKKAGTVEIPLRLDPGENAALSLAKGLGLRETLVDEAPARTAAKLLGLTPRGTLFVLLEALKRREIDIEKFTHILNQMIGHGFRLKEEVYLGTLSEGRRISEQK